MDPPACLRRTQLSGAKHHRHPGQQTAFAVKQKPKSLSPATTHESR